VKIDMHVHTNVSSPCSLIDPTRLPDLGSAAGIDALCVTEHDDTLGADVAARIGRERGFPIFKGVEIFTELGDMLVFGLEVPNGTWKTPFDELVAACRAAGAVIVPAHPCRIPDELVSKHGRERVDEMLDACVAVETHNGGCTPGGNEAAMKLAADHRLPGIGGSDAHHEFQVGRCYTVFEDDIATTAELLEALREGRCRGACPVDRRR
jgi:hypothetical protein